jgi:hypothetical protein
MTNEYELYASWMKIEIVVGMAVILANIVILVIRGFFIQRLVIDVDKLGITYFSDFLESQCVIMGFFVTFFVPACFLFYINQACAWNPVLNSDPAAEITRWQFPLAFF